MQYIILVLRLRVSNVFHRQHNRMDVFALNPQEACGGSSSELATPLTFMEEVVQRVNGGSCTESQWRKLKSIFFPFLPLRTMRINLESIVPEPELVSLVLFMIVCINK